MGRSGTILVAGIALLAWGAPAEAQVRASAFSVGGRVQAAAPTGDHGEGLSAGTGFEVDAGYDVRPGLTLYAGFSRAVFPVDAAEGDADRVDSGIDLGLLSTRPVAGVPLWFRAGLVFHEAETHLASGGGDGLDDGKTGVGLDGGLGVTLRLGRHLAFLPGVAWTAYPVGDPGGVSNFRAVAGVRLQP